jgi:hypothetical protein
VSTEVVGLDDLGAFGAFRGTATDITFDAACAELNLDPDECLALRDATDGDVEKARKMAVVALADVAGGACAAHLTPAAAPACRFVALKLGIWVNNMITTLGRPTFYFPCAIPLKGTKVEDLEGRFFLKSSASKGLADLNRGFTVWPEAESMVLAKNWGCGGHMTWQVFPGRAWLRGGGQTGWIDWPGELLPAFMNQPDRIFVLNRDRKRVVPNGPTGTFSDTGIPIRPGHYTIDPDKLPSLVNGAVNLIKEEGLKTCPSGFIKTSSGVCVRTGGDVFTQPKDDLPSAPSKKTTTGVKVAVGVGVTAAAVLALSRLTGR